MTLLTRTKPLVEVVRRIVSRDNGVWLDSSDMSTMYQDATGTTPVTAMEQPVGKWLDKSGNGNHATQSITASRPVISARKNLLIKTEDFANAAWWKYEASFLNSKFTESATAGVQHILNQSGVFSIPVGVPVTYTCRFKAGDGNRNIALRVAGASGSVLVVFNPSTGQYVSTITTGKSWTLATPPNNAMLDSDGYFTASITAVGAESATVGAWLNLVDGTAYAYNGDGVSSVVIKSVQLEYGTTATPYQRVNTATDYDTAGFPKYLKFDGIDDYLDLPYMGLYANGSATSVICVSISPSSAETTLISERSTSGNNPVYRMQYKTTDNKISTIIRNDLGTNINLGGNSAGLITGVPEIFSLVDSGAFNKPYKNSVIGTSVSTSRSGAVSVINTTVGATVSLVTTAFLAGNIYGLVITKSALSDSDRRKCEVYLGRKAGVQL